MAVLFSSEQLEHAARALRGIHEGVERAAVPALNRASLAAKTFGVRKLAGTYTAKRSDIVRTVKMAKATRESLVAGFESKGGRLPLTQFRVSPRGPTTHQQRLTVSVRRDSGGKSIGHGFANLVRGGRLALMQRKGKARYPVRMLFGPAAPQMFGEEGVREEIESRATEMLARRFDHEIGRMLKGSAK